jgi:hypothetical protein
VGVIGSIGANGVAVVNDDVWVTMIVVVVRASVVVVVIEVVGRSDISWGKNATKTILPLAHKRQGQDTNIIKRNPATKGKRINHARNRVILPVVLVILLVLWGTQIGGREPLFLHRFVSLLEQKHTTHPG